MTLPSQLRELRAAIKKPRYKKWPERVDGTFIGYMPGRGPTFYKQESHRLILGGSGSGKGSAVVIPMLLHDDGHGAIVLDPNGGQIARATHNYLASLGPVHVIDPYGVSGVVPPGGGDALNPLDVLSPTSPTLVEDAAEIVSALAYVPDENATGESGFFDRTARGLLTGLLVYLVTDPGERADLLRLRELLTMPLAGDVGRPGFYDIIDRMAASAAGEGTVARYAGEMDRLARGAPKTFEGAMATARAWIGWLEFQGLRRVSGRSTFDFAALRQGRGTLFVVLPDDRLIGCASWLRLICHAARSGLQRAGSKHPMHFVIDEAAALGRFEMITAALRAWRYSGLKLHIVFQNLAQIKGTFGPAGYSAITDAGLVQFLGSQELETLDYVSKMIGERDMIVPTWGDSTGWTEGTSESDGITRSEAQARGTSRSIGTSTTETSTWSTGSSTTMGGGKVSTTNSSSVGGSVSHGRSVTDAVSSTTTTSVGDSKTVGRSKGESGGKMQSFTVQLRRAFRPEQLRQLPENQTIVIAGNSPMALLYKEHYFGNPLLVGRALCHYLRGDR